MAAVDRYLEILVRASGEALWIEPGRTPRLVRGGSEQDLALAPLDGAAIAELLLEISPRHGLPPAPGEMFRRFEYEFGGDDRGAARFEFRLAADGESWRLHIAPLSAVEPEFAPVIGPGTEERPSAARFGSPIASAHLAHGRINDLQPLIATLLERRGSDLHLSSSEPPRLRVDGELEILPEWEPPSSEDLRRLLFAIAPERSRAQYESSQDADFAYELPASADSQSEAHRFRVNLFRDHRGFGAVLRHVPQAIPSAESLGLPDAVKRLCELTKGLVLVTGPTGCGKSTTLAALLDRVNRNRSDHILTIEDPIEFVHPSRRCLVNQREVGAHTGSFKSALRAALREDPDVILIGEMRDLETIAIALETAETGHLVFGTLHTSTAASTIERLVDQFPGERQPQIRLMLAESLRAVVAQTLLKKIGGGRVAAYEVLVSTPAIAHLIRDGKTFQIPSAMQTGKAQGMTPLNDALADLVRRRLVEPAEAMRHAIDKEGLATRLRGGSEAREAAVA